MTDEKIINRVAESSLLHVDWDELYPAGKRSVVMLKDYLIEGFLVKEKEFREAIQAINGNDFQDHYVTIESPPDAIVPLWAYMLVASRLSPFARDVFFGSRHDIENKIWMSTLQKMDWEKYRDGKVIVHGCGHHAVPEEAFVFVTQKLQALAQSILYGEACSSVPVYKKAKEKK